MSAPKEKSGTTASKGQTRARQGLAGRARGQHDWMHVLFDAAAQNSLLSRMIYPMILSAS